MASSALLHALAPLIDAVYPPRCPLCADMLAEQQGLCAACWRGLDFPGDPACDLCSLPLRAGRVSDGRCDGCLEAPPGHQGVHAATLYNAASRALVTSFKYGGRMALASMLARLMAARLAQLEPGWVLVPVPLHRWRLWRRGYNQAALLARELAPLTRGTLLVDGLRRQQRTPPLARLDREARAQVMQGAIIIHEARAAQLAGARVLLVDDVLTSGATSNACIAALRAAGVAQVRIACFARVAGGMMGGG